MKQSHNSILARPSHLKPRNSFMPKTFFAIELITACFWLFLSNSVLSIRQWTAFRILDNLDPILSDKVWRLLFHYWQNQVHPIECLLGVFIEGFRSTLIWNFLVFLTPFSGVLWFLFRINWNVFWLNCFCLNLGERISVKIRNKSTKNSGRHANTNCLLSLWFHFWHSFVEIFEKCVTWTTRCKTLVMFENVGAKTV